MNVRKEDDARDEEGMRLEANQWDEKSIKRRGQRAAEERLNDAVKRWRQVVALLIMQLNTIMDPIISKLAETQSNALIAGNNSSFFIRDILSE